VHSETDAPPLRIALFTDTFAPQLNGVAKTLGRWLSAMTSRGHEVRVFTTSCPGVEQSEPVRRFPSIPFWAYQELRLSAPEWRRTRAELAAFEPTLVHAATPFGVGLAGRRAALDRGVPFVTSYHTNFVEYSAHYGLGALQAPGLAFLRWFHNSGARTLVPTAATARDLAARGFRNLAIWSRGVDAVRFQPGFRDPAVRARMGATEDSVVVAYVGRVAREKGIDVALEAMRAVIPRRPGTVLAIAGDGPHAAHCRRVAPRGTYFAGRLTGDALSAFYSSADVFVFPSITDTFGNVLLEAMASGLAIVAADVPQAREVVGRDAGMFATPNDARTFADAIVSLVDDRAQLALRRGAALVRARTRGWPRIFDALVAEYRRAAGLTPSIASRPAA
jgi:glycosyltransferase involved in cell wall biosynthesis